MLIEQRINNHVFKYDSEVKILSVDDFNPECDIALDISGIKTLQNMFKFLEDIKLM